MQQQQPFVQQQAIPLPRQQLPFPQPVRNPFQQQPITAPLQQAIPNQQQVFQQQEVFVPFSQQQAPLRAPEHPTVREPDLSADTRINELLSANARRGGLVRIEPESELIRRDPVTGLVVPVESRRRLEFVPE